MTLFCTAVGAVLLWSITLPVGTLAPQGGEVTIEVCRVGLETLHIETQFFVFERPAGNRQREIVCFRQDTLKHGLECRSSTDLNIDTQVVVP